MSSTPPDPLPLSALLARFRAHGDGLRCEIGADWLQGRSAFGGLVAALGVHALRERLRADGIDPPPLRALQTSFVAPVDAGAVEVVAQRLRSGRSAHQAMAQLRQGGQVRAVLLAVFAAGRDSAIEPLRPRRPDDVPPPEALPPGMPLDLVMPKTAAEFLVSGSAFAPGGQPVQTITTSVTLGALTKRLSAVGDRYIQDGVPTQPAPFVEMPMGWDRAYGGPNYAQNPLGRGIEEAPIPGVGFRVALPNVVLPAGAPRPSAPGPVNYGPIDIAWPQRAKLAGTHDQRWLENDFPGFARDIDWRMFMAASPDQRFPGFLKGDEDYAIANMHPEEPEITGRLPGLQPRLMIRRRGSARLEDVPLSLTTVWFFPTHKRLVMIHHGRTRVEEEDARDIEVLLQGADRLGAPRPIAEYEAVLAKRLDPENGLLEAMRDSDLVPAEMIIPDPELEAAKARFADEGLLRKRARAREVKHDREARERVAAMGLDPDKYVPPLPPERAAPDLENLPAAMEALREETAGHDRRFEAFQAEQTALMERSAAAAGVTLPPPAPKHRGPPAFAADQKRAEFEALARRMEADGADPALVREILDGPESQRLMVEAEAKGRETYLATADGQDPAPRLDAAANAAVRARLLDGRRGGPRLDLCGADLSGLDLSGFDLTEAWLDGADLTGTNLAGARLERAVLAHARLARARLVGAELAGANLGRAILVEADLTNARLREAVLRGADLRRATLARADLTAAQVSDARLEGADLSQAIATDLVLSGTPLAGLRAVGAKLEGASFVKVAMAGVDLSGADLRKSAFITVAAQGAVFEGAELGGAAFVETCDLRGARFGGVRAVSTNFRGCVLEAAVFDGAVLDDSDFSDCNLQRASFDLVAAKRARFVAADLRGARITRSDLAGASLARADIRATDLSDTSLYEADLARIHGDAATRYERIQRTRVRLNPRRTPA